MSARYKVDDVVIISMFDLTGQQNWVLQRKTIFNVKVNVFMCYFLKGGEHFTHNTRCHQ